MRRGIPCTWSQPNSLRISKLLRGFDALCDNAQTQAATQINNGLDDHPVPGIAHQIADEGNIDLDFRDGKIALR